MSTSPHRVASLALATVASVVLGASAAAQDVLSDRRRTPVVEVVERVKPAVVSITTNIPRQISWPFRQEVDVPGPSGTGAVIFEDGFIITNYHVVNGAPEITVRFDEMDDDRVYQAVVVSKKPEEDLALLKIDGDGPFPTVRMCETDPILGEPVIAIGNAFGHSHTVSTGIVSGLHRDLQTREGLRFQNLIQTDASINPGNSGGPLLNIDGELIGINSAMQGMAENIGFAIPVSHVRKVLSEQLLALSEARAWLGFDVDEETLVVTAVTAGGPADLAGIRVGDEVVALAGHLLASVETDRRDVYRRVRISILPGSEVPLRVRRGRSEEELRLVAGNKVDGILFERMGIGLETVYIGQNPFLHVTQVQTGGPAGLSGVLVGDVITTVQRERGRETWFQRPEDLAGLVARLAAGAVLDLEVWRDLDGDGIYFEKDAARDYSERFRGPVTLR